MPTHQNRCRDNLRACSISCKFKEVRGESEMTLENTNLVLGIIIFVMVLILFYRQSRPVTLGGIVESYEEGVPLANELATISRIAVGSAEHLGLIGDLVSNEDKLEY